jgi:hypothetical protein
MVERSLSYLSYKSRVFFARVSPFFALFFSFILFKEENAVSVAEKYADNSTKAVKTTICLITESIIYLSFK